MAVSILEDMKISQVQNGAGAGTTAQTTSAVDMQGFDSIIFVASLGTVTSGSVLALTVYSNAANANTGGTAETGATAGLTDSGGASSNELLVVDLFRPLRRYVYATLTRTTDNAVLNCIIAIQYNSKLMQPAQSATIAASAFAGPNA